MEIWIDPRLTEYLKLRKKALQQREAPALFQLGQIYLRLQTSGGKKQAFSCFRAAAAHGYAQAQFMMGVCHEKGIGIRKNFRRAVEWYQKVDNSVTCDVMDHPGPVDEAENETLRLYLESPRFAASMDAMLDARQASAEHTPDAIREAAERGDADAQNYLGHLYYYGREGLEKDREQAGYWYRKSAQQGCEAGVLHWAQFCKWSGDYEEAARWYRQYALIRLRWREERLGL